MKIKLLSAIFFIVISFGAFHLEEMKDLTLKEENILYFTEGYKIYEKNDFIYMEYTDIQMMGQTKQLIDKAGNPYTIETYNFNKISCLN